MFAEWFKRTFPRVEATREANRQVGFDFGQTQALEHPNAEFNELLEKLPNPNADGEEGRLDVVRDLQDASAGCTHEGREGTGVPGHTTAGPASVDQYC